MRLGTELAAKGISLVTFDCEGNGTSSGTRGLTLSFDRLSAQAAYALDFARGMERSRAAPRAEPGRGPTAPAFLMGESMGGALAINTALESPELWAGLVLIAPMCGIDAALMPPAALVAVARGFASCCPGLAAVPTADHLPHCFRIGAETLIPAARADPMRYSGLTRLGTGLSMLTVMDRLHDSAPEVTLPLLVIHGARDAVTDPSVSRAFWDACGSGDKTYLQVEHAWHVMWVDDYATRAVTLDVAVEWILQRTPADKPAAPLLPAARVLVGACEDEAWTPEPRSRAVAAEGSWWAFAPGAVEGGSPKAPAKIIVDVTEGPPMCAAWAAMRRTSDLPE